MNLLIEMWFPLTGEQTEQFNGVTAITYEDGRIWIEQSDRITSIFDSNIERIQITGFVGECEVGPNA